jgi:hypothetical protein
MDKKTFQPGDFQSLLAAKMQTGLGDSHHGHHSEEVAHKCASGGGLRACYQCQSGLNSYCSFSAITRCMRHTLPALQSTIESHISPHQSMVQVTLLLTSFRFQIYETLGTVAFSPFFKAIAAPMF